MALFRYRKLFSKSDPTVARVETLKEGLPDQMGGCVLMIIIQFIIFYLIFLR
ncbi:MAG: hypothetical protein ACM3RX_10295 [Methanococcaceae archaeon]